ncbi:MAG: MMPL family transporter [Gammaproteobacteria bacterium]|nr:MMPL family transporter [Gammaproteobacteria bacterium]
MSWISRLFDSHSQFIVRYPWPIILLTLGASIGLVSQLPGLVVDTSPYAFFEPDDPIVTKYDQFLKDYDRDEVGVITIKTENVFDRSFLQTLQNIHHDLEQKVPYLDEVLSLINATSIKGKNDELIVKDLLETMPADDAELDRFKQDVLTHPLYPSLLISSNAQYTSIIVRPNAYQVETTGAANLMEGFDDAPVNDDVGADLSPPRLTPKQIGEFSAAIFDTLKPYQGNGIEFLVAGLAVVNNEILVKLNKEVPLFTGVALLLIAVLLFFLFRRFSGVVLPIVVVLLALLVTLSLMAISGKPFNVFTQILPSFLLAVGVGDAVHLLTIFYREYARGGDKRQALRFAVAHTGLPMLMTSLTTAAGLLSFSVSEIAAIGYLGIFSASGVLIAFVFSMTLLPALIVVLPIKHLSENKDGKVQSLIEGFLRTISTIATRHYGKVILASSVIALVALYGAFQLRFYYNAVDWFPKDDQIRVASEISNKVMDGNMFVEVLIDTGELDGVKKSEFLQRLEVLQTKIMTLRGEADMVAAKTISIVDTVKLIHQALHNNDAHYHKVPDNDDLVSQEILLFENSGADDLRSLVSDDFSKARLSIKLPWTNAGAYESYLLDIRNLVEAAFEHRNEVTLTGMISLLTETSSQAIRSMTESYILAAFVIGMMMMLLLRSARVGLIAMIPNLFPILVALGFMGLLGFPLDLSSILVGSIAIGLSVDDTIYFMHHFKRYFSKSGDVVDAVDHTLHTAGRAMLVTTIVLSIGFFVFGMSDMTNLVSFGLVTGVAIIMALIADIVLAPALMAYAVKSPSLSRSLMR